MARYVATVDLWDAGNREALDSGALVLQPGQWIRAGQDALSRFYRHNRATGHVVAFHGPRGRATRQMRGYIASGKGRA